MTVQELKQLLEQFPEDALVMVKHQLIGNENCIRSVTYEKDDYRNPGNGVVRLGEIDD
jgi:hypothetical protein